MPKREFLADSLNDKHVFFDPVESHTATHFADTPNLKELAIAIIKISEISGEFMILDTDMGHSVGMSDLVTNDPGDVIIYAKRTNRNTYTIFNKTKKPQPSSLITTAFELQPEGSYELVSAWIGPADSPPFPGDERETSESKPFWTTHSLAWGAQEIQAGSETPICPW